VTEVGTCYTLEELRRLREFCRANGLLVYMDGARLANAAAFLGCSLADLAAGADVLSFGGSKNGAMAAEALIVMNASLAAASPVHGARRGRARREWAFGAATVQRPAGGPAGAPQGGPADRVGAGARRWRGRRPRRAPAPAGRVERRLRGPGPSAHRAAAARV